MDKRHLKGYTRTPKQRESDFRRKLRSQGKAYVEKSSSTGYRKRTKRKRTTHPGPAAVWRDLGYFVIGFVVYAIIISVF